MSNTEKSSDDKGVFIFLIVISLIYFAHYYAQHGWGYILEHFRGQTINFIRWVVTFIFGIIVIIWGLIPFAMPNSDIKSVKQWILGTAFISSFYILVIIIYTNGFIKILVDAFVINYSTLNFCTFLNAHNFRGHFSRTWLFIWIRSNRCSFTVFLYYYCKNLLSLCEITNFDRIEMAGFINTYCPRCRKITIHDLYFSSGGYLHSLCTQVGKDVNSSAKFQKQNGAGYKNCTRCGKNTEHIRYISSTGYIHWFCCSCGRNFNSGAKVK